jgi:hypothetical protein
MGRLIAVPRPRSTCKLPTNPSGVKIEIGGVLHQAVILEGLLVLEHGDVHLGELSLGGRGFSDFGSVLRVGVHCRQREVAEDVTELVAEHILQLLHDRHRCPAVRTLVIAVLNQRHQCRRRSLHAVALAHRQSESRDAAFMHGLPPDRASH